MVDNSWIHGDRARSDVDGHNRVMKLKVILSVSILLMGGIIAIAVHSIGSSATMYQAEGILIDAGEYRTFWSDISYTENSEDPVDLLNISCMLRGFTCSFVDGELNSMTIDGNVYTNDSERTWGLWYVDEGEYDFKKAESYEISASDYTVVAWAYMGEGEVPAVAVDATATCIYGYSSSSQIVTLSPVCTEIIGAMKATTSVVGTDESSNYPSMINTNKANKLISIVGTYSDPSYEAIMALEPDIVICDGSMLSQVEMARSLRNSNVNAVVVYNGEDFESIVKNTFLVGAAIGYEQRAKVVVDELEASFNTLKDMLSASPSQRVMVTLGSNPSPYVAASNTYINDIVELLNGDNVFSYLSGWPQVVSEYIQSVNPTCIIVIDEGRYSVDEYDLFMNTLSQEWKSTDAYNNGNVYLLCGTLSDISQRYVPRTIQLVEIIGRIFDSDVFPDDIVLPKAIGDNYQDYLTITKEQGYDL